MRSAGCVVVGGGPSGIATALFLASAAPELRERIVVLEKERYPREKICAGAVGRRADRLLATIGVMVNVPHVPISGLAVRALGERRVVRDEVGGRVVRRAEFDHALAASAVRRGIEVRDGVRVTALTPVPDGWLVGTSAGELRADIVVGADGAGSFVRRAVRLPASRYLGQAVEVDTEPVAGDFQRDLLAFDLTRRDLPGYFWDFPTIVGSRKLVCRGVYVVKQRGEITPEIDHVLAEELAARGLVLSHYRKRRYAERGFHPGSTIARRRVLLVGEAAGIDPVTGEGIAQCIQYGAVAGTYLARKLRSKDVDFADWAATVRRGAVGRDLGVRSRLVGLAYGRHRAEVERFLFENPDFLRLGFRHFGGLTLPRSAVARVATTAALRVARALAFE